MQDAVYEKQIAKEAQDNQYATVQGDQKPNLFMNHYTTLDFIFETFPDEEFLIADGFNEAVIGIDGRTMNLIYSISKCIDILIADGLSRQDALEHFEYNVRDAYVGEKTPIWCDDYFNM